MKNIPDEKQLEQLLETVPPEPGARIDTRLAAAPWTRRGVTRRRISSAISLAVLALAVLTAATPGGRAWAQGLLNYFTRAGSDTLAVTPIFGTTTPYPGYIFNQAIAEVEQQAGFDVLEPIWLPGDENGLQKLTFDGASYEPEHNIVRIFYRYILGGEDLTDGLVLRQERFQTVDDCELCGMVGASAIIETVQIGDVTGEYVQGVWKADDSGVWNWVPDPYVKTLRWQIGDMAFEIQYFGLEVDKADLIAIAESMK